MRENWTFLGWYYNYNGEQIGPFPAEEIARLVALGQLRPSDEVLKASRDANNKIRFYASQGGTCQSVSTSFV
jgi:GYF domain 2